MPPISRASFLNSGPAVRAMTSPVRVPPVNESVGTRGCDTRGAPASSPRPCTMLTTPGGPPTSRQTRDRRNAVIGVSSDGLATTVFPVAIAGAIFQLSR